MQEATGGDLERVERLREAKGRIAEEIAKVIVGQDRIVEELLIALLARGHCLLIGVPGLAKTLLISTLAKALDLKFSRIQFTPDLMPSDITGTDVIEEDVFDVLTLEGSVAARNHTGGTAPEQVRKAIATARKIIQ